MELRHLRYFVAVAEAGTTVRAAARVHVAQQALSRQLADLERELGVALFARHPRGMALTPAGEEFLDYARGALAANARAVEHVRRHGAGRQVLRVGVVEYGRGQHLVLRAAADFRARYPHVAVAVDGAPYAGHPGLLRAGRLDVGFYGGRAPNGVDLAADVLLVDSIVGALVPADDPLIARSDGAATLSAGDLKGRPLLTVPRTTNPAEVADELARLDAAGWRGSAVEAERPSVIMTMVAFGAGWACVPGSLAGAELPGTAYRPLADGAGTQYNLHALTRADDPDPLTAAFLACLRQARADLAGDAAPAA